MISWCFALLLSPSDVSPADLEFFEARIRPVLIERCYRCHNSVDSAKGRLALDHSQAMLEGGRSGPAIVPGDPEASLLMRAVRHEDGVERMPRDEPKLEPDELADFAEWIRRGAPDPRDRAPTAEDFDAETSWEAVFTRRMKWWSFQPIAEVAPPEVEAADWVREPIDRFLLAGLEEHGLSPSPEADRPTLLRRLSLVLTGLPPTPAEFESYVADEAEGAYERQVDRLLSSPHHAERWARHWMDLFRFAESHGSEGDPRIPESHRYRDALIRAFDADVPYDRMVREHIAGDLLEPRVDPETGIDDAAASLGHFRFVQHGYGPTDALDEQVRFTDNQVDVVTKAFLGLTVSCARCHDHKFDPISQKDFYALYGVLISERPGLRNVDGPERRERYVEELRSLRGEIHRGLAAAFLAAADGLEDRLLALPDPSPDKTPEDASAAQRAVDAAAGDATSALAAWLRLKGEQDGDLVVGWKALRDEWRASEERLAVQRAAAEWSWSASEGGALRWHSHGNTLNDTPAPAGFFSVLPEGERVLDGVHPAGYFPHELSTKHSGILTSSRFPVETEELWIRASGAAARARYSMQHYPRVAGPPYKNHGLGSATPRWYRWDMRYWNGDDAYLEVATARDIPVEARGEERSWWGLYEVVARDAGEGAPRDEPAEVWAPLFAQGEEAPAGARALAARYSAALRQVVIGWRDGTMQDPDARFLDDLLRAGLLPTDLAQLPELAARIGRYRELEAELVAPTRAPGLIPGDRIDQPLFTRGDHTRPESPVPQRFLDSVDATPYDTARNGRQQLAEDLVRPDNPLAARVAVNRLWHWVFGQGLVRTTDNFGRLGEQPSHPELLDWLATDFVEGGWSMRRMLRRLVCSSAFRQSSPRREDLAAMDPEDRWLGRMPIRRLEAEAIRDSILTVSGRLDRRRLGASVDEGQPRRGLYVRVQRNNLPAFLTAFDMPLPFTTTGARDVTNVPAQSLALMNDPLVVDSARAWARRILGRRELADDSVRVGQMFLEALGRPARAKEVSAALAFLEALREEQAGIVARRATLDELRATADRRLAELRALGRERALSARGEVPVETDAHLPAPVARWDFDEGLEDSVGAMHGEPIGTARVEGGQLIVDGGGYVLTKPYEHDLRAKTLEAWVKLDTLEQSGGGVLTVQDLAGNLFDSIVFAEREPHRWMAGSNVFARTQNVGGAAETSTEMVHVAVSYAEDGTIQVYRGGRPYGGPYTTGVQEFTAGNVQAVLGMRHGTRDRRTTLLQGAIERAQLYDRALSAEEIAATSSGDPNFVPVREVLAALTESECAEKVALESELARLRGEVASLDEPDGRGDDSRRPWRALAQSLFSLKEFLYLR